MGVEASTGKLPLEGYPRSVPNQTYALSPHVAIGADAAEVTSAGQGVVNYRVASQREHVSLATAEAIEACGKEPGRCRALTCLAFRKRGYLAENYMHVTVAKALGIAIPPCE